MILICKICGTKFKTYLSRIKIGKGKYCSKKCSSIILFKKGHIPWTKGKKGLHLSKKTEFKKGMVSWNKGLHISTGGGVKKGNIPWNKGLKLDYIPHFKHRNKMVGEKNPAWKGGVSTINQKIRKSFEYEEWRRNVFKKDNYTCQHCGKVGGWLEADHIKLFSIHDKLRFDVSNGQTLCEKCHDIKTALDMIKIWKKRKKS